MDPALEHSDSLGAAFAEVGARRRLWTSAARLAQAVWVWWLAALALVVADATWPMPAELRAGLALGMLVAAAWLLWRARPRREDPHRSALRDARAIELHHRLDSNELVAGLALRPLMSTSGDAFAEAMARRSIERGRSALAHVDREVVVDRSAARRHAAGVAAVAILWAAAAMWQPSLVTGGVQRLAAPMAQTPPFSFTRIEASVAALAQTGGDVTVTAALSGRPADSAQLVELDEAGDEVRRWPMQRLGEQRYAFTLQSLREPMMVRIEAGDGRSPAIRIMPAPGLRTGRPTSDGPSSMGRQTSRPGDPASSASDRQGSTTAATDPTRHGTTSTAGAAAGDQPVVGTARTGVYRETAATIEGDAVMPDAVMQQAPPAYHPLIRRYFDRLAADQQQEPTP